MSLVAIKCPGCGAEIELDDSREFGFCNFCGTKVMQEKIVVEHKGNVKIDNSEKLDNLYKIARRARDENNTAQASKYYDLILQEEPNSWEAIFYSTYYSAAQSNLINLENSATMVINCSQSTLSVIKDSGLDDDEAINNITEIVSRVTLLSIAFLKTSIQHYNSYSTATSAYDDARRRCKSSTDMIYSTGNTIEVLFKDNQQIEKIAVIAWKKGIECDAFITKNISGTTQSDANERIAKYLSKIKKYDGSYIPPEHKEKSGCYVATAVYGSYDCPQVWTLRRYRDKKLASTWYGRAFINMYYATSPTIVKYFGNTVWFNRMWRGKLDRMVKKLNAEGYDDTPYSDK